MFSSPLTFSCSRFAIFVVFHFILKFCILYLPFPRNLFIFRSLLAFFSLDLFLSSLPCLFALLLFFSSFFTFFLVYSILFFFLSVLFTLFSLQFSFYRPVFPSLSVIHSLLWFVYSLCLPTCLSPLSLIGSILLMFLILFSHIFIYIFLLYHYFCLLYSSHWLSSRLFTSAIFLPTHFPFILVFKIF